MKEYADVHKSARILEGEIDLKLTNLNKMCSNPKPKFNFNAALPSQHAVETAGSEIQDLLGKLNHLHGQMSDLTADDSQTSTKHTLQRHGEILQDYKKELEKILDNYRAAKEREELLAGRKVKLDEQQPPSDVELQLIRNADFLVDHQLSVAYETKVQLLSQRKSMKKIQTRLRDLYHRFPVMNDLLRRAGFAQYQKAIILVVVVLIILGLTFVPSLIKNKT